MRDRTADLLDVNQALSQLSYSPNNCAAPTLSFRVSKSCQISSNRGGHFTEEFGNLVKEVIQPQVPLRLPCYDFTPVADPTVAGSLLKG